MHYKCDSIGRDLEKKGGNVMHTVIVAEFARYGNELRKCWFAGLKMGRISNLENNYVYFPNIFLESPINHESLINQIHSLHKEIFHN